MHPATARSPSILILISNSVHPISMGFFDRFRKKEGDQPQEAAKGSTQEQPKRIKRYTSEGKPVYE